MNFFKPLVFSISIILFGLNCFAQTALVEGQILDEESNPLEGVSIVVPKLKMAALTDSLGHFSLKEIPNGNWAVQINFLGFDSKNFDLNVTNKPIIFNTILKESTKSLDEFVVSGTMKEVSKSESPVPIEVYTSKFFKANPTPSLFDALQNINGVRPQLNCNVCNTGDIHINGLEGPYTMILIDGMPIVSGLSTVYGLSGIPQALIDRIEVVKGPASTLYGSEAVGGLINVITKRPSASPLISADLFSTSWGEFNADVATKMKVSKNVQSLLGVNYFNYSKPIDNNGDNFTDVTLQNRISIFNKWNLVRNDYRMFTLAARYVYEDRWGGEMNWARKYRGGDEVYGESVYTSRFEFFGTYQLPVKEQILFQFSGNSHHQNSAYGNIPFLAQQYVGFGQLTWFKTLRKHDFLSGITYRATFYDDNTIATADSNDPSKTKPTNTLLPGAFVQDEITINRNNKLLLGIRYDYNSLHGSIFTPRINYKWNSNNKENILRLSVGNGYRVANVFTEDHAALSGSREVVFANELRPETSWNGNINFVKKLNWGDAFISLDATAFYTYFDNKIIANFDTDPNKIIYDNLSGHAISQGVSLNLDILFPSGLKILAGGTAMDVYSEENKVKTQQLFSERFTAVWNIGYTIYPLRLSLDYTGNLYGPMRLPLLSSTDPRLGVSPWWSIQNVQLTKKFGKNFEIYGGIKNLLDWTPNRGNPFLIARANDPFDKNVQFGTDGQALVTPSNPYGLTFDPSYVFGPNQGRRGFLGVRFNLY